MSGNFGIVCLLRMAGRTLFMFSRVLAHWSSVLRVQAYVNIEDFGLTVAFRL